MRNIYLVGVVGSWLLASSCGRLGTGDDMFGDGDGDVPLGDGDAGDGDLGDGDAGDGDLGDGDLGDGDTGDGDIAGAPGDGDGDGDLGGAMGDGDGDSTGGLGGTIVGDGDGDGDGDIEPPDPSLPVCVITAPLEGSTTAFHGEPLAVTSEEPANQFTGITFRATATDLEDGVLVGESIAWFRQGDGVSGGDELLGFGNELTVEALPPGENKIFCQVIDSEKNEGEDFVTLNVKSPVLYIYHPGTIDGPRPASESIEFVSAGFDYEDGTLNTETFVWESNIDGLLGVGNGLYKLSAGVHTVTVKGMDSEQNSASAEVTVTTVAVEILPPVLE